MADALGDRMKMYEMTEAGRRFFPFVPVMARLDGKCFSSWTKGLHRPYDWRLSYVMETLATSLVKDTNACCGYTQSDEITLCWYSDNEKSQIYFDGRVQKITSVLAAECSVMFNHLAKTMIPEKKYKLAVFDCRVWQLPTLEEAANCFLWRELDATKNSIQMTAQSLYSHKELQNKHTGQLQEMIFRKGINWNDYPAFFKRGSYVQRRIVKSKLTPEDLENLPPFHDARKNPDMEFERSVFQRIDMPLFSKVTNRVGVIFRGEEPRTSGGIEKGK